MEAAERESKLLRAFGKVQKARRYDRQNNDVIRRSCTHLNGDVNTVAHLVGKVKRKAANCIKYVWPVWGSNPRHSRY